MKFDVIPGGRRTESPARVTARQAEVLELRRRLSRRDTAAVLGISEETVKVHQARAVEALGAESLADAVALLAEMTCAPCDGAGAPANVPARIRRAA